MFKCEVTGKVSQPREKQYRVVTKTRKAYYYDKLTKKEYQGWEIVEEKKVCEQVYKNSNIVKGEKNGN